MFAFQLGREYKLSIAEIIAVFPEGEILYSNNRILISKGITLEKIIKKANCLGGTIKIINLDKNKEKFNISDFILKDALNYKGKYKYSINIFSQNLNLKNLLNKTKSLLKNNNISSRFVNKDFLNLSSAQIIGEKLIQKESDYNLIINNDIIYIGKTIWVQDINNYSKRDWQKNRDMQTGMLPPKLAQIMVNLSKKTKIYDPFVGLATILIESVLMGNLDVYGSDVSQKMVDFSLNNIKNLNFNLNNLEIFVHNAKYINEVELLNTKKIDGIVSEGYLGEIMTQKNISIERINKQKESLLKIYTGFFSGLKKIKFNGNIILSFPFWEINGKYNYFYEIYELLNIYCDIQPFFPTDSLVKESKSGSLLYKRPKQLVGREIFSLKIKK